MNNADETRSLSEESAMVLGSKDDNVNVEGTGNAGSAGVDINYQELCLLGPEEFYKGTRFEGKMGRGGKRVRRFSDSDTDCDADEDSSEYTTTDEEDFDDDDDNGYDNEEPKSVKVQRQFARLLESIEAHCKAGLVPELERDYSLDDLAEGIVVNSARFTGEIDSIDQNPSPSTPQHQNMRGRKGANSSSPSSSGRANRSTGLVKANSATEFILATMQKVCMLDTINPVKIGLKLQTLQFLSELLEKTRPHNNCTAHVSSPVPEVSVQVSPTTASTPRRDTSPKPTLCSSQENQPTSPAKKICMADLPECSIGVKLRAFGAK